MSSFLGGGGGGGGGSVSPLTIQTYTASHSLVLADAGCIVEMNVASANTLAIPFNSMVPFPVGSWIKLVQVGAGATTVVGDSHSIIGAGLYTVLGPGGYSKPPYSFSGSVSVIVQNHGTIAAQWDSAFIYKRATDEWVMTL